MFYLEENRCDGKAEENYGPNKRGNLGPSYSVRREAWVPAAAGDRDARPLGQAVLRMRCIILDPSAVKVFKSQHK